ncbi:MAG: hypothetical protein HY039_13410 [Nitrospirae bacterium]|nr:hypothetical protein [Nitrospirota bacterium]
MFRQRLLWIILALTVFLVYFASSNGIVSSNDGSHTALLLAIVEDGSFSIDKYRGLARELDYAEYDGRVYSDRPPGTALLTVPFYVLLRWAGHRWFTDPDHFILVGLSLVPALFGAASVLMVGATARLGGARFIWGLLAAVVYAFGTVQWRYGSALFSHGISAFFMLSIVFIVLRTEIRNRPLTAGGKALLGFLLGYALMVDYANAVGVFLASLFVWWRGLAGRGDGVVKRWAPLAAAAAVPVAFLLAYQWICFGSPFSTSYSHHAQFLFYRKGLEVFSNNPLRGWANFFLVEIMNKNPDYWGADGGVVYTVLSTSPLLLLAFYGLFLFRRSHPAAGAFLMGTVFLGITVISLHKTYWGGPGTADTRYILPWIVLLAPAVAWALQDLWARLPRAGRRPAAAVLGVLFVFTVFQHLRMQANFLDHDVEGVPFEPKSFTGDLRQIDRVWDHAFGLPEHVRGLAGKLK